MLLIGLITSSVPKIFFSSGCWEGKYGFNLREDPAALFPLLQYGCATEITRNFAFGYESQSQPRMKANIHHIHQEHMIWNQGTQIQPPPVIENKDRFH